MNNAAIREKIIANPDATDSEIVELFNNKREEWVDVRISTIEGVCRQGGIISRLEDYISDNTGVSFARTAAKELLGMIGGKMEMIEMSSASKRIGILAMLGALVGVGWVSETERDSIVALAKKTRTIAEIEDCFGIQTEHVAIARKGD